MRTIRDTAAPPTKLAGDAASQRHVLPKNLPHAVKYLSDGGLDQLLKAAFDEAKRRGRSPWTVGTNSILSSRRPPDLLTKRSSATDKSRRRQVDVAEVTLTRGQMNAVRTAINAGITPSRIARQFGYLNRACGRRWRRMNGSREMTTKAHLAELERQHAALEHELAEALAHSSTDDLKIMEIKRRKLILKDEIERVRHDHAL